MTPDGKPASRYTVEELASGEYHLLTVKAETLVLMSEFGKVEVLEIEGYGRGLFLDGRIQHVAADEHVFSEGMVHPAMFFLKERCRRVLCIGGGPGGICRELLKYRFVKKVTQVEIDPAVVAAARQYFPHVARGCWDDPRCELVIADAYTYLESCVGTFDLIISDLSEPYPGSPAVRFFTEEGITLIRSRLTPGTGIFVTWAGPANAYGAELSARVFQAVAGQFPLAIPYVMPTQTFGTPWLVALALEEKREPLSACAAEIDRFLAMQLTGELRFYDGETHHHLFRLPKDLRTKLAQPTVRTTLASPSYISATIRG